MFNLRNLDRSSVWFFLVAITTILFPWNERFSSIGIILLLIHWVLDAGWLEKVKSLRINLGIWFLWGFLLLHILQLFRTQNIPEAIHTIEVKLSFFLLPLLFSTENYLDRKKITQLMMLFCLSCGVSFLYALMWSISRFHQLGITSILGRMNISGGVMHPGYYANYFAFGLIFLLFTLIEMRKFSKESSWIIVLIVYFSCIEIFLVSKTALLFLGCFAIFILWYFISFIKNIRIRIGVFIVLGILLVGLASQIPQIKGRINETQENLKVPNEDVKFANSTKSRIVAWGLEWEMISKKWLIGYGTGNANPALLQSFLIKGYKDLYNHNMHTHNQVLHTWLDLGLLGVLLLLAWIIYFANHAIRKSKPYLFWLMVLILINCATDDMLEIQAGGVLFIFFLSLFAFKPDKSERQYY